LKLFALITLLISFTTTAGIVRNTPIRCQNERYTFTIQTVMEALGSTPVQMIGEESEYFENLILSGKAGNSAFTVITYGSDCNNLANTGELFSPVRFFTDAFNAELLGEYAESLEKVGQDSHVSESGIKVNVLEKQKKSAVIKIEQPKTGLIIKVLAKRLR